MRRSATLLAALGVVAGAVALVLGFTGVTIDVPSEGSYDCGSALGRLGGDEAEAQWGEDTFLQGDNPDIPKDDLPNVACKDATDERLTLAGAAGGVAALLVLAAVVVAFIPWMRRRRGPAMAGDPDGG